MGMHTCKCTCTHTNSQASKNACVFICVHTAHECCCSRYVAMCVKYSHTCDCGYHIASFDWSFVRQRRHLRPAFPAWSITATLLVSSLLDALINFFHLLTTSHLIGGDK